MDVHIVTKGVQTLIAGVPETRLLESPDDVVGLLEICFEHRVRLVLLYAENLTAHFFDLSSGEAGAILQKLRNYRIKVAVVAVPGGVTLSPKFQAMMAEERQGDDFAIFADPSAAEVWLLRTEPVRPAAQ